MLDIEVSESTVGRYMDRTRHAPSQGWKTFLRNYARGIASIDRFVVRTASFKLIYGLMILRHARGRLIAVAVTVNPTAEWIAYQVTEAFPWDEASAHVAHDLEPADSQARTMRPPADTHTPLVRSSRFRSLAGSIMTASGFRFWLGTAKF